MKLVEMHGVIIGWQWFVPSGQETPASRPAPQARACEPHMTVFPPSLSGLASQDRPGSARRPLHFLMGGDGDGHLSGLASHVAQRTAAAGGRQRHPPRRIASGRLSPHLPASRLMRGGWAGGYGAQGPAMYERTPAATPTGASYLPCPCALPHALLCVSLASRVEAGLHSCQRPGLLLRVAVKRIATWLLAASCI